jgi:hypothetical protein
MGMTKLYVALSLAGALIAGLAFVVGRLTATRALLDVLLTLVLVGTALLVLAAAP